MNYAYVKLIIATLLPVLATMVLYFLDKKTAFGGLKEKIKQGIYGLVFGALAIVGNEWGIPLNGAQVNCRDAAVLTAGLMFGAPAGIIAGIIGGLERWIAVAWGLGYFTRIACTISTVIAGFYSALLRKYMFEDKKPGWLISLAIGVVMEILHLTMVFITNMATPTEAMAVVRACTIPMVLSNGLSVMLSAVVLTFIAKESFGIRKKGTVRISQTIQRWMLLAVFMAFAATSYFVYGLQDKIAKTQADTLLNLAFEDVVGDIRDASNENLLALAHKISSEVSSYNLKTVARRYDVAEISIVNKDGIISDSTEPDFIGFDMSSGKQSAEFLCLLEDTEELVQDYGPISYDGLTMRKYAAIKTDTGFLQIGYDAIDFQKDISGQVQGATKNRHVGKTGYILIVDEELNIISAPKNLTQDNLTKEITEVKEWEQDTTFLMDMNNQRCYCRYRMAEGYYIISILPEAEALQLRNIALYVNTFMEVLVFAILFGLIYLLIKKVVVNQIKTINCSLAKITGGNLNEVVNVRSNEEFASLSDDINSTVDTLKHYIAEASARIDKELEFAKNIQSSALPSSFPAFPKRKDFDIYASMNPAREVGGDFYDFYLTNTDTLNFLVADVSGKGIPAAMFMMRAKTELKRLTEADMSLCDVFTDGNEALCEGNDAGMFVTAWQGSIDLTTGIVQFVNAGHNPPLVRRGNGKFQYLKSRVGFVLAGMDGVKYKTQEINLDPGDIIYLYTDGVTEATNRDNELYGEERLLEAINSREFDTMQGLCKFIKGEVDTFVGEASQFDDITMLALKYNGTAPVPSIYFEEAKLEDIHKITEFVELELERIGCPMKAIIQINVAIDEIYSNIVKYAYPKKRGPVTVQLIEKDDPNTVYLRFSDEGKPYNPLTKEDPDISLSAEERSVGGLGIYMVKKTMDDLRYKFENGQNILTIKKVYNPEG